MNSRIATKYGFIFASLMLIFATFLVIANLYIYSFSRFIITDGETNNFKVKVGIVFGSGITNDGKPYKELASRLDIAHGALKNGVVEKLILSGDNRFNNYNEPDAMINYLVDKGVDKNLLQPDYAGRSTYESCERASKIFGIKQAILFSAKSHLPRAIFTCRSFGIESFGIGSNKEANNAFRRELIAKPKAMFNVYIWGEETLLGDPISIE